MSLAPKDLQDKWNKILKDEGLEIESPSGMLGEYSRSKFQQKGYYKYHKVQAESNEEYYRLAGHFLHDYEEFTEFEKTVWALHSDGLSHRDIETLLGNVGRTKVGVVLKELTQKMITMYKVNHD